MNNILKESYDLSPIKDKHSISKVNNILMIKDPFKRSNALLTEQVSQTMELMDNTNDLILTEDTPDFYKSDDYIVDRHIAKGIGKRTVKLMKQILVKTREAIEWIAYQIFGDRKVAKAIAFTGSYIIIGAITLKSIDKIVDINNSILKSIFNFTYNIGKLLNFIKIPFLYIKGLFKDMFGSGGYQEYADISRIQNSFNKSIKNIEINSKKIINGKKISDSKKKELSEDVVKVKGIINIVKKNSKGNQKIIDYLNTIQKNKDIMYKGIVTKLKNQNKSDLAKKVDEERKHALKLIEEAKASIKEKVSEDK